MQQCRQWYVQMGDDGNEWADGARSDAQWCAVMCTNRGTSVARAACGVDEGDQVSQAEHVRCRPHAAGAGHARQAAGVGHPLHAAGAGHARQAAGAGHPLHARLVSCSWCRSQAGLMQQVSGRSHAAGLMQLVAEPVRCRSHAAEETFA